MVFTAIYLGYIIVLVACLKLSQGKKTSGDSSNSINEACGQEGGYFLLRQQHRQFIMETVYKGEYPKKTYIDVSGYRRFTDSDRLVSHWVAEKFVIHRKLNFEEVVHHIDGNKLNNKPSNLMVFINQQEHLNHHRNNYKYNGSWCTVIPEYTNYKRVNEF